MESIMLTWNPDVWDEWDPPYAELVRRTRAGERISGRWSVANRVKISIGSDAWLLRQGKERGLVGHGLITSEPYRARHYSDPSRTSAYVDVEFDRFLDLDDAVSIEMLRAEAPDVYWDSFRSSGMTVPAEGARELDELWTRVVG